MAFTDARSGRIILKGLLPLEITLAGTVKTGDPLGYSSGWKAADGNNSIYAELVAGRHGVSGDRITAYRIARIGGVTTGTAGNTLYLSDTEGEYAASAGTVSQRLGFELGNSEILAEPKNIVLVRAEQVDWDDIEDVAAAKIIVGNASARPVAVAMSGDIAISNAGVTSFNGSPIVNADVNAAAAIAYSKLNLTGAVLTADLAVPKVVALATQTLGYASFTDNTDATGYIDSTGSQIPAGAIVLGFKAVVATGFTGDTTAVIQVGINGDLDRFSAVTDQSVLAAATVGASGASDAQDGMNAAQTIRVTVTGGADFTSISAGSMVVTVYYIATV